VSAAEAYRLALVARSYGRTSLRAKQAAAAGLRDLARYFGREARADYVQLQFVLGGVAR
jgi:hypothetical protein